MSSPLECGAPSGGPEGESTARRARTSIDRSGEPLLSVRDLAVRFPLRVGAFGRVREEVLAVDGVSFDIWPGETLGLVGESGCGKSTTARAILRLLDANEGRIVFDGLDVGSLDRAGLRALRSRVQIVFQDPFGSLDPRMSVGSMLQEALTAHRRRGSNPRARAGELLERVGLAAGDLGRFPHEFSGGQRQRLGIARALSVEPDFLVLDEPVSALDVSVQAQVINLLDDLQRDLGLTYLFIAHDLALVEHVSDRVAVMYLGRIVEIGGTDVLYDDPRHPYTQALLAAVPRPDPSGRGKRRRIALPEAESDPAVQGSACPFEPRCPHPLKDELCKDVLPPMKGGADGHFAACHHQRFRLETRG